MMKCSEINCGFMLFLNDFGKIRGKQKGGVSKGKLSTVIKLAISGDKIVSIEKREQNVHFILL